MARKKTPATVKKIFQYDNYRMFLRDFFNEQKQIRTSLSKRYFAKKAGFSSHSQISHLIAGRRNITRKTMDQFLEILRLEGKAAEYFVALVNFNQAKSIEDKEEYFKKLNVIRQKIKYYKLEKRQYKYFEKWYYPVIREIAVYLDWGDDYKKLAKSVDPPISVDEAKDAVKTLLELNMITRNSNGRYVQVDNVLYPGEVPSYSYKKARRDMILQSIEASERLSPDERYFFNCTLSLSEESHQRLLELIQHFEREFESIFITEDNTQIKKVHQFNLQFFPVSKDLDGGEDTQ